MKERAIGVRLNLVTCVEKQALVIRWVWGGNLPSTEVRGVAGNEPLPPVSPTPFFDEDKELATIRHRAQGLPQYRQQSTPCPKRRDGLHVAWRRTPEVVGEAAFDALSRKAACAYCGGRIPHGQFRTYQGREDLLSTPSGLKEPGAIYFRDPDEARRASAEAVGWYGPAANGVALALVLPNMEKYDLFVTGDDDEHGIALSGKLPDITTGVIDAETWVGRVVVGEFWEATA